MIRRSVSLVTGGAGFIGGHLVDKLLDLGHEVRVIDNYSAESNDNFYKNPEASYHELDICDYEKILPLFEGVDYVFHLAAQARIMVCMEKPQEACRTNYLGTCNVLEASRQFSVKRVIYSSTSSAYGLKNKPPLREDMPTDCLNPYSVSKVAGEDLCKMYSTLWGLETVIFRYFNVYGERQPTKGQYAPVIGLFKRQVSEKKKMTVVGDGEQTRDYTHVSDVVEVNIRAALSDNKKILGEVINVGTGTSASVLNIVNWIGGFYEFIPERPGEARDTLADTNKLNKMLDYVPKVALNEWMRNNNE